MNRIQSENATVSCKVVHSLIQYFRECGQTDAELQKKLTPYSLADDFLRWENLLDRQARIPWNSFCAFLSVFDQEMKDPESRLAFMRSQPLSENSWVPHLRFMGSLISSPKQLYWWNNNLIAASAFGGALLTSMKTLEDGRLLIQGRIADGLKESKRFFEISHFGMQVAPSLIGLPDSFVESEIHPREATYWVTPPPSLTIWARLSRAVRMIFSANSVINELLHQDLQLRQSYERLQKSEAALQASRRELERRVEERTSELLEANRALKERLDEITKKDHENLQLSEQLSHLQRLEALGTMTGSISHEINNVLHGILLSIEAADRKLTAPHEAKDKIQTAREFAERGQNLVKQVLAFSRKAKFQPQPTALVSAIKEATRLMRSTLPRNVTLVERYPSQPDAAPWVFADSTQLQQIIINLCSNSAHALRPNGGAVRVEVDIDEAGQKNNRQRNAVLKVCDNGEGIAPENIDKIFKPFFTTKSVDQGTGMGLAVVKSIVENLGGNILVVSTPATAHKERETRFEVRLPLKERPTHEDEIESDFESLGGSERLLVIDDEPELLALLNDTLSALGYTVAVARSGEEALQLFAATPFDLVLTDHFMPGINGVELAKKLRAIRPTIPVLLCTGGDDQEIKRLSSEAVSSCVTKPLDAISLNEAIRSLL